MREKTAKLEAELEKRPALAKPQLVIDLETAKTAGEIDIAALEEEIRYCKGKVEAYPGSVRHANNLAEAEKELAAAKRKRIDDRDPQDRMRGALGKVRRLQGLQGKIVQRLYDKEERIEQLAAEIQKIEEEAAAERAEHSRLQKDIEELRLEHKRAAVTADGLLPMLQLWYEAYKADPCGRVAESAVDSAFTGIATLLGQLEQHRVAVRDEPPPPTVHPPTNAEDFIAASVPAYEAAEAAAIDRPVPVDRGELGADERSEGRTAEGSGGDNGPPNPKPARQQSLEEILRPRAKRRTTVSAEAMGQD